MAYERIAKDVKFGPDDIEAMRKDVLLLLRNVERVESFEDAQKFRSAVQSWTDWYNERIYEYLVPNIPYAVRYWLTGSDKWNEYFREQEEGWTKHWDKTLRTTAWNLYLVLRGIPVETGRMLERLEYQHLSPDEVKRTIQEKWAVAKHKWAEKVKRNARNVWNTLGEFLEWLRSKNVDMTRKNRDVTQQEMQGFSVRIVGFEAGEEWSQRSLTKFEEGLRLYRQRAAQVLPLLLRKQLPIEFNLDCKIDAGGRYEQDHVKVCGLSGNPKDYVHVLAHEMGHHLWRTYVSDKMQTFWLAVIRGDYTDLDLHDLLQAWEPGENIYSISERLQKNDPILALQVEILNTSYNGMRQSQDFRTREDLETYLAAGKPRTLRVPANPITAYATKNEEEAFCEVVGYLVAYGSRAVLPEVRGWFETILPGYYREASMAARVAERFRASSE